MEPLKFELSVEEVYQVIGELEMIRRKQNFQLQSLFKQIDEMSAEIERLNGKLGESNSPIELHHVR